MPRTDYDGVTEIRCTEENNGKLACRVRDNDEILGREIVDIFKINDMWEMKSFPEVRIKEIEQRPNATDYVVEDGLSCTSMKNEAGLKELACKS